MDHSSLAEAQKQQQQQQSDQQQAYDPAQAQAYAAYYAACDQYYAASGYYHQPYYPHEYSSSSNAAPAGAYYGEAQPDSTIPQPDVAQIHHAGSYGAAYGAVSEQDGYAYQAQAGMNPAAVAALSQLSQLSGSIDAAERMMSAGTQNRAQSVQYQQYSHPMMMQHGVASIRPGVGSTHRGGGRSGGGPPTGRGGNRGRIGQRPPGGGPPTLRGRGFGRSSRGRGRRPQNFPPESQQQQTAFPTASEQSAYTQGRPLFAPKAPKKSLLPAAWCDICRVDCNSLDILEQHKNGKRHKRTVQRVQEIQSEQKVFSGELQFNAAPKPAPFMQVEGGHKLADGGGTEAGKSLAASVHASEVNNDIPSSEPIEGIVSSENSQHQMPEGQSEPASGVLTEAPQDETLPVDGLSKKRRMPGYNRNDRWRGSRLKMVRVGRGTRYFRSFDRMHNRPIERPRDRPRVCTVCNVMCDTMAVFECHLSGKKHISRIKRFESYRSVYGPISAYIPPNQMTAYPNKGPEPLFYGLQSLEALQQESALRFEMLQQGAHGAVEAQAQPMEILPVEQSYQPEGFEETGVAASAPEPEQSLGHPEEDCPVADAIEDEQAAAMPDPDERSCLNDSDAAETNNSAPDNEDLMDSTVRPDAEEAALPELGAANEEAEIAVPALNANSEEPIASIE